MFATHDVVPHHPTSRASVTRLSKVVSTETERQRAIRQNTPPHRRDAPAPHECRGGEGAGLPPDLAASADTLLTIPMRAPVESLNVSIAAALILFEASRQRGLH